ncbi:MAG: phosphate ABC transporter substrate-binding protein [Clostridiales bacterium]|nr:phosphate ABC transporter substrate-binding protein [Clostridiales bacterium]
MKRFGILLIFALLLTSSSKDSYDEQVRKNLLSGTIRIAGSTSMEKVTKTLAGAFTSMHPNVTIDVQLGGSSSGIAQTLSGIVDIGNTSRELNPAETGLRQTKVAIDAIAVITNKNNPVTGLSLGDLQDIFTGKYNNWHYLCDVNFPILPIGRENGSGTRMSFESIVLGGESPPLYGRELGEAGSIISAVANYNGGIGYVSLAFIDESVRILSVDGYMPSEDTIRCENYKLHSPYIMVTREGENRPLIKSFLDFVLSKTGQEQVRKCGLIPVG